jgi:membrane protein DedA with SNARE-associated domain
VAHDHDEDDLPQTWPFTLAGLCLLVALSWFCLGFALEDVQKTLPAHYTLFWWLLLAGVILVIGGAAYNITRDRRRRAIR